MYFVMYEVTLVVYQVHLFYYGKKKIIILFFIISFVYFSCRSSLGGRVEHDRSFP